MNRENWNLIKEGSVKDIYSYGESFIFDYSDRYSIFDWGEMPDKLENKGTSLAVMAYLFFDYFSRKQLWKSFNRSDSTYESDMISLLQEKGLSHHCEGLVDENLLHLRTDQAKTFLKVKPVRVEIPPIVNDKYDYSFYKTRPVQTLVPLEVIFRFGVPKGSSLLRRLKKNPSYLSELGLEKMPKEGDVFDKPIIEFSTKLESSDTYLKKSEAFEIASLNSIESARLMDLAEVMAIKLKEIFKQINIELWDGKFEYAFQKECSKGRSFLWVDSMGPDEVRLIKDGAQLSKEFLRQAYNKSHWLKKLKEEKEKDKNNFKKNVLAQIPQGPGLLPLPYKQTAENIYTVLANSLCGLVGKKEVFSANQTMHNLVEQIKRVNQ